MSSEIHVAMPGSSETLRFAETVRIGRTQTNAIVVNDASVSAEHVELRRSGEGWEIVDLESANGTFIGGRRVTRALLDAQTSVRLGVDGPEVHLTIHARAVADATNAVDVPAIEPLQRVGIGGRMRATIEIPCMYGLTIPPRLTAIRAIVIAVNPYVRFSQAKRRFTSALPRRPAL